MLHRRLRLCSSSPKCSTHRREFPGSLFIPSVSGTRSSKSQSERKRTKMVDVQQLRVTEAAAAPADVSWAGAPALAASTVDMKNTSGSVVTVYVSAGTVTVIKVGGVTTGLTSGSFRLRRGQALNITYSVAPTLKWL